MHNECNLAQLEYFLQFIAYSRVYHGVFLCMFLDDISLHIWDSSVFDIFTLNDSVFLSSLDVYYFSFSIINRPGVAGAVLQTPLSLIN